MGLYVDDFIYFSQNAEVESAFETKFKKLTQVQFMGQVGYFLGTKFSWKIDTNKSLTVHMIQEAFIDQLVDTSGLTGASSSSAITPYRSGLPVDSIPVEPFSRMNISEQKQVEAEFRSYVGSLLWISQGTRPDMSTITHLLAKNQTHATHSHVSAAKNAIKYL